MPDLDRLIAAIDAASETAYGGDHDSDLERERSLALDYYHGRNIEPAPEGRSQVVDRSVFETVQWILPSLCRIFANGDDVVEFAPFGPEDEQPAKQESDYLNYLITQKNPWFQIFLTWAQDALLTKNAYCLSYIEEKIHTETETYEGQSDESVALLTQDEGVEVVEIETYPDGEPQVMQDPVSGLPTIVPPPNKHDLTIRRVKPQKRLRFKVLPPERTAVSEQTESFTLEDCDYFEYWDYPTISDLRAQGFDIPDDIASDETATEDVEDSRNLYNERTFGNEQTVIDPAMRRVRARMIWIRYDYDEDGIAELQKVLRVGRQVFDRVEASRIPVACIVPSINTHRHIGTSIADMVADIQRIKTAILRQGLDNLYHANNPRTVINERINLDDMLISRPGGVVRSEGDDPVEGNYSIIATPNVFPQAMEGLEYMDRIREGRTGVSRHFAGIENDHLLEAKSATEVSQLSTMAAQRVEQIARIIASGVEYLFSVAHELVSKSGHKKEVVKLRGEWVEVDPSAWRTGRDMRIVVGYGAGNKDALASRLLTILNLQKEAMGGGLRIANENNVYEAVVELTKASDFTAPQRFWTDPSQLPPPEPQPSEAEIYAGVEQSKLQTQERVKFAELDSEERLKAQEIDSRERIERFKGELQVALKNIESGNQVDLERLKGAMKNEPVRVETQKIDALAETTKGMAQFLAELRKELNEAVTNAVKSFEDQLSAPREVVRDQSGRVAGVKVGGKERKVARDSEGRVSGLQ